MYLQDKQGSWGAALQHCVKKHRQFTDLLVSEPKLAPAGPQGPWFCLPFSAPENFFPEPAVP